MSGFPNPKLNDTQAAYFPWMLTGQVVDYIAVVDRDVEIFDAQGNFDPVTVAFKLVYPICSGDPIFPYLRKIKSLFESLQKKTINQNKLDIKMVIPLLVQLELNTISPQEAATLLVGFCRILLYVYLRNEENQYGIYNEKSFKYTRSVVFLVVAWLLENEIIFEESEADFILDLMVSHEKIFKFDWDRNNGYGINYKNFINNLSIQHQKTPLSQDFLDKLILVSQTYLEDIKAIKYVENKFNYQKISKFDTPNFNHRADQFGPKANQDIESFSPQKQKIWSEIIDLGLKYGDKTEPTKAVLQELKNRIEKIGIVEYYPQIQEWFTYISTIARTAHARYGSTFLTDYDERIVVALIWSSTLTSNKNLARALSDLVNRCFKKVPEYGFEAQKIGNRGLWALANMPDKNGLVYLLVLKYKLNQPQIQKVIDKLLEKLASSYGLTVDQVLNDFIPDFGLRDGLLIQNIGDYEVVLQIERPNSVVISYQNELKKPVKTLPKTIKDQHKEELNELKAVQKDVQKMLSAQKVRLDSFYLGGRSFDYQTWKEKFLAHGLLGELVKRLIWTFEIGGIQTQAIYSNGQMVDFEQRVVLDLEKATQVTLWHPMDTPDSVSGWQDFIVKYEIEQPFKQAFREIYESNQDEQPVALFSNRFASHILKQHQMSALAKGRSWKYSLLGAYDDGRYSEFLKREIPSTNITASLEVYRPESQVMDDWVSSGIYKYVYTDKIRFSAGNQDISFDQVPRLIFSEIMRDIDLFVSVTTIGNDPEWFNNENLESRDYWSSYNYDNLDKVTPLTTSRYAVLERLLPKLAIGQNCHLEPTFLVVNGVKNQYKIYLGSAGIYIMPQMQFLCIVEDVTQSTQPALLPFENDTTVSLIISKAILLTHDDKISDFTILKQLPK